MFASSLTAGRGWPAPKDWSSRDWTGPAKWGWMATGRHSPEQVINELGQAEVAIAEGCTVVEASRQIGVTQQTFYLPLSI